jgi:hypothetical protein
MTLPNGFLMITKDGDLPVGSVVGEDLFGDGSVGGRVLELLLHCVRGVVRSEDLGGEASHEGREMLVDDAGLEEKGKIAKPVCQPKSPSHYPAFGKEGDARQVDQRACPHQPLAPS